MIKIPPHQKLVVSEIARNHLQAHTKACLEDIEYLANIVYMRHHDAGTLQPFTPLTYQFDRDIGYSGCVAEQRRVLDKELILVQKRIGRNEWSRATRSPPTITRNVTIILNKNMALITAYCGPPAPREPWDKTMTADEREESIEFWRYHALCLTGADHRLNGVDIDMMTYKNFVDGKK